MNSNKIETNMYVVTLFFKRFCNQKYHDGKDNDVGDGIMMVILHNNF